MEEKISEVDIAYQILSAAGKDNPIYFKTLIREIIAKENKVVQNEAAAISEIYTAINMDSRFQHVGDGKWGLADWYPAETKRTRGSGTRTEKASGEKKNPSNRGLNGVQDDESKSRQEEENNRHLGELMIKLQAGTGGERLGTSTNWP